MIHINNWEWNGLCRIGWLYSGSKTHLILATRWGVPARQPAIQLKSTDCPFVTARGSLSKLGLINWEPPAEGLVKENRLTAYIATREKSGPLEVWSIPDYESLVNAFDRVHYTVILVLRSWRTLKKTADIAELRLAVWYTLCSFHFHPPPPPPASPCRGWQGSLIATREPPAQGRLKEYRLSLCCSKGAPCQSWCGRRTGRSWWTRPTRWWIQPTVGPPYISR